MAERHLAMVEARVRFPVAAPRRSSPIGKRRHAQTVEDQGSNPWGGTQVKESEPGRSRASLLTSARLWPWASIAPLSATDAPPCAEPLPRLPPSLPPLRLYSRPTPPLARTGPGTQINLVSSNGRTADC